MALSQLCLVFLISVGLCSAGFQPQSRMVKSNKASDGQFPYMVSLFDNRCSSHVCGGAIINDRYILSAASCYTYYKTNPTALSASMGSAKFMNGAIEAIEDIIIHSNPSKVDLALLKTIRNIQFTNFIQPIALPTHKFVGGEKTSLITSGYGFFAPAESIHDTMHFAHTMEFTTAPKFLTTDECKKEFSSVKSAINENFICTTNKLGRSICLKDKGNPLVHQNVLVGVAAEEFRCYPGYPDLFTNTFSHNEWIQSVIDN